MIDCNVQWKLSWLPSLLQPEGEREGSIGSNRSNGSNNGHEKNVDTKSDIQLYSSIRRFTSTFKSNSGRFSFLGNSKNHDGGSKRINDIESNSFSSRRMTKKRNSSVSDNSTKNSGKFGASGGPSGGPSGVTGVLQRGKRNSSVVHFLLKNLRRFSSATTFADDDSDEVVEVYSQNNA